MVKGSRRAPLALALSLAGALAGACTPAPEDPSLSPESEPTVENLAITEPGPWKPDGSNWTLRLAWSPPDGFEADRYEVSRDGAVVAEDVSATEWIDLEVQPSTRYVYSVAAISADDTRTREAVVPIETQAPAVEDARLDGAFVMTMRVERARGTRDPVSGGRVVFRFDPGCAAGPCAVRWRVRDRQTDAMLQRRGDTYRARARTPLFIKDCGGVVVDESVKVRLRVTAAAPISDRWQATRIEGSIEEASSSAGCLRAAIDWSLRGVVLA